MCVSECVYNASMERCQCVVPNVMFYHEDRICTDGRLLQYYNIMRCKKIEKVENYKLWWNIFYDFFVCIILQKMVLSTRTGKSINYEIQ